MNSQDKWANQYQPYSCSFETSRIESSNHKLYPYKHIMVMSGNKRNQITTYK